MPDENIAIEFKQAIFREELGDLCQKHGLTMQIMTYVMNDGEGMHLNTFLWTPAGGHLDPEKRVELKQICQNLQNMLAAWFRSKGVEEKKS